MLTLKKVFVFALLGFLFGILAYQMVLDVDNIGYETIVNNTNLAPTIHPSIIGTGERVDNETYWNNESEIELHVFAHADNSSQTAGTFLYINDTLISGRSGRPLVVPETAYRGIDTRIPKRSSYRVDFQNYHHYEWREYPILIGRNTTLSINQSNVYNNYTNTSISDDQLNLKVNKSGDTMSGDLTIDKSSGNNLFTIYSRIGTSILYLYSQSQTNFANGLQVLKKGNSTNINGTMINNEELGYHSFYGWNGVSYVRGGYVLLQATETWNTTHRGSKYTISTIKRGTTTEQNVIISEGNLTLDSTNSCIQMKNNTGTNYKIEVIGTTLTVTLGTC